jgi:hypothetical protein
MPASTSATPRVTVAARWTLCALATMTAVDTHSDPWLRVLRLIVARMSNDQVCLQPPCQGGDLYASMTVAALIDPEQRDDAAGS